MNSQVNLEAIIESAGNKVITTDAALAYFDALEPVTTEEMLGKWRGRGFPTHHPMDGLLENFEWWGKEFASTEEVHPLVFNKPGGGVLKLNPFWMPLKYARNTALARSGLSRFSFKALMPVLQTRRSRARLRMLEHRGKVSATMVYDAKPINDVFRKIDDDTVLGLMDLKGMKKPFFFLLERHA